MTDGSVPGLLLAAGAGSRMGRPKALMHHPDGTSWLRRSVQVLMDGGCARVVVVLGAESDRARASVPDGVEIVVAENWAEGQSASLCAGLRSLAVEDAAAVISLVDLPDVGADVVGRLLTEVRPATLSRATYDGRPGHPVVLGRDHWAGVLAVADGDEGAKSYLREHGVERIECGDLATGQDRDAAADLP